MTPEDMIERVLEGEEAYTVVEYDMMVRKMEKEKKEKAERQRRRDRPFWGKSKLKSRAHRQ